MHNSGLNNAKKNRRQLNLHCKHMNHVDRWGSEQHSLNFLEKYVHIQDTHNAFDFNVLSNTLFFNDLFPLYFLWPQSFSKGGFLRDIIIHTTFIIQVF